MADVSRIKLPNGNTYDIKDTNARYDIEHFSANDLAVLQSKTYTNVTCTGNSDPAAWLYFFKVVPSSATTQAYIKYRVTASIPGVANNAGFHISEIEFVTFGASVLWYKVENADNNGSYRPFYNHIVYRAKAAGITNNYGHLMGLRFQSAYEPANASYKRTITIDILETKECTATFFDSPILYANAPGTGSTNYDGRTEYNGTTQGDTHTGDADNNFYTTPYSYRLKPTTSLYRYMLCFTKNETNFVPVNAVSNSTATTKTLTAESFDPFGPIFYYNSTTTKATTEYPDDCTMIQNAYFDLRYSFNCGTTLINYKAVYVVLSPQSDGSVKLHSSPLTQSLPSTDDGLLYLFLGVVYANGYSTQMFPYHPIYYYKDSSVRLWTNAASSGGGSSVVVDVNTTTHTLNITTDLTSGDDTEY